MTEFGECVITTLLCVESRAPCTHVFLRGFSVIATDTAYCPKECIILFTALCTVLEIVQRPVYGAWHKYAVCLYV